MRGSALVLEDWAQILEDWAQIPEDGLQILEDWAQILEDWLQRLDDQAQILESWPQPVEDWTQMPEDSPENSPKPRGLKPRNTLGTKCSFLPPLSGIGPRYGPEQPSGNQMVQTNCLDHPARPVLGVLGPKSPHHGEVTGGAAMCPV